MKKTINLTEGNIGSSLFKMALPIMATSFIQMAYNMTDMIWIGRVGSDAVAAVGTAGFYPWFGFALALLSKVGTEIKVAQTIGEKNFESTKHYITCGFQINIIMAILYGLLLILFKDQCIGFFNLGDDAIIKASTNFLSILSFGMIFSFLNPLFSGIFTAIGDSKTPFVINTIGLVFNIIFDPLLIFGLGPIKGMGTKGAAIATVLAQAVVTIFFIIFLLKRSEKFFKINIFSPIKMDYLKTIIRLGIPVSIQNGLFTVFSMFIGKIVAEFGFVAIAVQKVGTQIEAITWMTAGGFSTALSTFVAQNYGAKKFDRITKGYKYTILLSIVLGVLTSLLLIFCGGTIFKFFINEKEAIASGTNYLRILGFSQLFMCLEITTTGAFNGLGRTSFPSVISTVFTGLRIPMAYFLCQESILGLNGVWWSISFSCIIKGVLVTSVFLILLKTKRLYKEQRELNIDSASNF